jgi:hypothetical protein
VAAALAKGARVGLLDREEAGAALGAFTAQWNDVVRLQLTETVATRAAGLAWEHGMRGYDTLHLAVALFWQETLGQPVILATFDRGLWEKATQAGLAVWPVDLERYTRA